MNRNGRRRTGCVGPVIGQRTDYPCSLSLHWNDQLLAIILQEGGHYWPLLFLHSINIEPPPCEGVTMTCLTSLAWLWLLTDGGQTSQCISLTGVSFMVRCWAGCLRCSLHTGQTSSYWIQNEQVKVTVRTCQGHVACKSIRVNWQYKRLQWMPTDQKVRIDGIWAYTLHV